MSTEYTCTVCCITCTGPAPYEQHLKSAKHLNKVKFNERKQSVPSNHVPLVTRNENKIDDISVVPTNSQSVSADTMRILLEWNHPLGYKPYCDVCHLPLHGNGNADLHFASDNDIHTKKFAAWKRIEQGDVKYSCKVCSEIFPYDDGMSEHFLSENHASTVRQKDYLTKFIQIYQTYNELKRVRKQKQVSIPTKKCLSKEFNKMTINDTASSRSQSSPLTFDINHLTDAIAVVLDEDQ